MIILKKITLIILVLIALIIGIGFILPSDIYIQEKKIIDAPAEMIFDQINNLHMWERWSPWHKIDPEMNLTYLNNGIGTGSGYSWQSKHKSLGNGTLMIVASKPFEYINTEMEFSGHITAAVNFRFLYKNNQTMLSWDMKANIGNNPIQHWMGLLIKKSVSEAYIQGLNDIDDICQTLKEKSWYSVNIVNKPPIKFYGITCENVTPKTIASKLAENYPKIQSELTRIRIEPTDVPFARYYSWGDSFDMQCCIPVEENTLPLNNLETDEIPGQLYAIIKFKGPYSQIEKAHLYLIEWLKFTKFEINGPFIEKYITNPQQEPDSTQWETTILYPIK